MTGATGSGTDTGEEDERQEDPLADHAPAPSGVEDGDDGPWFAARCRMLALVPFRLGHHPGDGSVVVVGLAGLDDAPPQLVARTDGEVLDSAAGRVVARSIAAHLVAMRCERVLVVHYRGQADPVPRPPAASSRDHSWPGPAINRVRAACARVGVGWDSAWTVDASEVRQTPDAVLTASTVPRASTVHTATAVPDSAPRERLDALVAAIARTAGWTPAARRADLGRIAPAAPGDRRAAAEARSRWLHRRPATATGAQAWGEWQRRTLARWQDVRTRPDSVARTTVGRVEAGLTDPLVVEASALAMIGHHADPDRAERLWLAGLAAPDIPVPVVVPVAAACRKPDAGSNGDPDAGPDLDRDPDVDPDPDPDPDRESVADAEPLPESCSGSWPVSAIGSDRPWGIRPWLAHQLAAGVRPPPVGQIDAARLLLERVVAHGRDGRQSGALTLLALFAWWVGDGVRGSVLVERALAQHPVDPLAVQLNWVLAAGALPGWARQGELEPG